MNVSEAIEDTEKVGNMELISNITSADIAKMSVDVMRKTVSQLVIGGKLLCSFTV